MMEHHFLFYPYRMVYKHAMRIFRRLFMVYPAVFMLFIACGFLYIRRFHQEMNDGGVYTEK